MTELVTDGQERKKRDERRGQLIGAAWLVRWNSEGRGRGSTVAGSWIRTDIAPREAPEYEWIWIEPYLTTEAGGDIDTYRGQQAGRALMAQFAKEVNAAAVYWQGGFVLHGFLNPPNEITAGLDILPAL